MSELATYQGNLPDTIEDLARFLLIAPEKANAMRAEIKAIQKVGLAKAVYDQKLDEQRRLCDMILDASVRLGEMTKSMPKGSGGNHGNQYTVAKNDNAVGFGKTTTLSHSQSFKNDTAVDFEEPADTTVVSFEKPKSEAVRDLGFSLKQVERFETLANNKDLVEIEKAKAKEENRMPTRTNVIDMARAKKDRFERNMKQIDQDSAIHKAFISAVFAPLKLPEDVDIAGSVYRATSGKPDADLENLNLSIERLCGIRMALLKEVSQRGKK